MKKFLLLFLAMGLFFISCDSDDNILPEQEQEKPEEEQKVELENEINDFIWKAMNSWYFWQDEVFELSDDRFVNDNDYFSFLNGFATPVSLFRTVSSPKDRFSVIVDDYDILFNSFAGVFKTEGLEFDITRPPEGGNGVLGVVRYVIKGSDAEAKGIERGDIFYAVNNTELFAETDSEGFITSSNLDLLDQEAYTLNFAEISPENTTVPNNVNIDLVKQEITENPILISKVLEINGIKIGYVMYNGFTSNFDDELNNAFGDLKSQNVTELVLDLRYNGGGSVQSAVRLSSMITGQFTGELLSKDRWNDKWQPLFGSENTFVDKIGQNFLNSLNLSKVYVLATRSSASASEYVMNCLAPYIEVVHIGTATRGKNEFSVTLVDNPEQVAMQDGQADIPLPFIVLSEQAGFTTVADADTDHKYALQPLVGTNENADGFSEFTNGLVPDIEQSENLSNLGELGEPDEPLLAIAISDITGVTAKSLKIDMPENMNIKTISSSNSRKPSDGILNYDVFFNQ